MKWSISRSKTFSKCQRKWYFSEIVAQPKAKEGIRREVYVLKQLKSIYAWRGSLVDTVIHKLITPNLLHHELPDETKVLEYAQRLVNSQLSFGKEQKCKCLGVTKSNSGDNYCAFYDLEYNGILDDASLKRAEEDITLSLKNLLSSELVARIAKNNKYVISQRTLSYRYFDTNVICVPDMIVFFENKSPLIIDWKVHAYGNSDAWLQLGVYSVALSNVPPHKDFPENFPKLVEDSSQIDLMEFQLLKNVQRKYSIIDDDVLDIEDYIFKSITQMKSLVNGRDFGDLDASLFQTAYNPQTCATCPFKKLCWLNENKKPKLIQQTLLGAF
jgi:hypothetical protein